MQFKAAGLVQAFDLLNFPRTLIIQIIQLFNLKMGMPPNVSEKSVVLKACCCGCYCPMATFSGLSSPMGKPLVTDELRRMMSSMLSMTLTMKSPSFSASQTMSM